MQVTYGKPARLHQLIDRVGTMWWLQQSNVSVTNVIDDFAVLCFAIRHIAAGEDLPH